MISYSAARHALDLRHVLPAVIVALLAALATPAPVRANVEGDTCRANFDARKGPDARVPGSDLLVGVAPLAMEVDAPVGKPLHLDQVTIDFIRCLAMYEPPAPLAIKANPDGSDWIVMFVRQAGRDTSVAELSFGTRTNAGKWLVLHRRNEGEIASVWRNGQTSPTLYGQIRRPGSGRAPVPPFSAWPFVGTQPEVDTVGFVKPGLFGVATHVASFTYSTFWELASGMHLTFNWHCDSWAACQESSYAHGQTPEGPTDQGEPDDKVCLKKPYLPGCGGE
jgi:hypothetical protein